MEEYIDIYIILTSEAVLIVFDLCLLQAGIACDLIVFNCLGNSKRLKKETILDVGGNHSCEVSLILFFFSG